MKSLILMLLLSCGMYAQKNVYNVQHYCINEAPLKAGSCDVSGTEYSFVFTDMAKKELTLFLADNKLKYKIIKTTADPVKKDVVVHLIENERGKGQVSINSKTGAVVFEFADRRITLKTGKSTRAD